MTFPWLIQHIEIAVALRREGKNDSEIAAAIGRTKASVQHKLNSLGLPAASQLKAKRYAAMACTFHGATAVLALKLDGCRFPIGDPGDSAFRFCCAPAKPGRSYCSKHHRIAYTGTPVLNDKHRALLAAR